MKRCCIAFAIVLMTLNLIAQEPPHDRIFFENSAMQGHYFYSTVSYRAPSWVENVTGKLPVSDSVFFTPGNSLRLHYVSSSKGRWESKLLFKEIRGQDHFRPSDHLAFRIYVSSATSSSELPSISLGTEHDSSKNVSLSAVLKNVARSSWLHCEIPLTEFGYGDTALDKITYVKFSQAGSDGKEHLMYIDQLEFGDNVANVDIGLKAPKLTSATGYERHVDITWQPVRDSSVKYVKIYRKSETGEFQPVAIQSPFISRYTDFTGAVGQQHSYKISLLARDYRESPLSNELVAATKNMTDDQLLDMVQEAHFRYYWEGAEANSGLALENIHGRRNMIATGASGFGLMALIVGAERKFITREQLVERFQKILSFLEQADKYHGAFPHFIDGKTGKTEAFFGKRDNGADLVETSFLFQGLLAAREYFNTSTSTERELVERIDKLWQGVEWNWFRRENAGKYLLWHWSPDQGWIINHKLIGWNETLITYFMAISSPSHAVPASLYYSGWASQAAEAQKYRSDWGQTKDGAKYTNGNSYFGIPLKVGVSNGGPLFFVHYSFLGLDPRGFTDAYTNYFENNRNIARINYRYCVENPENHNGYGPDAWGLTASDGLWSYQADEPVPRQDHGKITPTGALASFPYMPAESMDALKNYYRNHGKFAWGEYGFFDAFNLDENWRSEIFMGLNQGPIVVMIENYRSQLIWKLFMQNKDVQQGLRRIATEKP